MNDVDRDLEATFAPDVAGKDLLDPQRHRHLSDIAGPDAKTHVNEVGAKQSLIPVRFDLVDAAAMFKMTEVLHEGAEKYGEDNWRGIPIHEHLNHMIMHAYAWLGGDYSDPHLSHIMCRGMFAQAIECQGGTRPSEYVTMFADNRAIRQLRTKPNA